MENLLQKKTPSWSEWGHREWETLSLLNLWFVKRFLAFFGLLMIYVYGFIIYDQSPFRSVWQSFITRDQIRHLHHPARND